MSQSSDERQRKVIMHAIDYLGHEENADDIVKELQSAFSHILPPLYRGSNWRIAVGKYNAKRNQ